MDPPTRKRTSTTSYNSFTDQFEIPTCDLKNGKRTGFRGENSEYSEFIEVAGRPEFPQFAGIKLEVTVVHKPGGHIEARVQRVQIPGGFLYPYVKASVNGGEPAFDLNILAYRDSNRSGPWMLNPAGTFLVAVEVHLAQLGPAAKKKAVEGPAGGPLPLRDRVFPDLLFTGSDGGPAIPAHSFLLAAAPGGFATLLANLPGYKPFPILLTDVTGGVLKVLLDSYYEGGLLKLDAGSLVDVWKGAYKYGSEKMLKLVEEQMLQAIPEQTEEMVKEFIKFGYDHGLPNVAAAACQAWSAIAAKRSGNGAGEASANSAGGGASGGAGAGGGGGATTSTSANTTASASATATGKSSVQGHRDDEDQGDGGA